MPLAGGQNLFIFGRQIFTRLLLFGQFQDCHDWCSAWLDLVSGAWFAAVGIHVDGVSPVDANPFPLQPRGQGRHALGLLSGQHGGDDLIVVLVGRDAQIDWLILQPNVQPGVLRRLPLGQKPRENSKDTEQPDREFLRPAMQSRSEELGRGQDRRSGQGQRSRQPSRDAPEEPGHDMTLLGTVIFGPVTERVGT